MKKETAFIGTVAWAIGLVIGTLITFTIFAFYFTPNHKAVRNAMLLCQAQVPENVTCKITAVPYEATVRIGQ
jgi:hypothetical protein